MNFHSVLNLQYEQSVSTMKLKFSKKLQQMSGDLAGAAGKDGVWGWEITSGWWSRLPPLVCIVFITVTIKIPTATLCEEHFYFLASYLPVKNFVFGEGAVKSMCWAGKQESGMRFEIFRRPVFHIAPWMCIETTTFPPNKGRLIYVFTRTSSTQMDFWNS